MDSSNGMATGSTVTNRAHNLRPLLAESSHSYSRIFGVASVRFTPIPATQMLESGLNRAAAFDPKRTLTHESNISRYYLQGEAR